MIWIYIGDTLTHESVYVCVYSEYINIDAYVCIYTFIC